MTEVREAFETGVLKQSQNQDFSLIDMNSRREKSKKSQESIDPIMINNQAVNNYIEELNSSTVAKVQMLENNITKARNEI